MSRTMIQAAATMNQLQNKLDLIGNNMANSQTAGYKSRQAEFSSLLYQQINNMQHPANMDGRTTPNGVRVGSGAALGSIRSDLTLGSVNQTGRGLDIALLQPQHFLQVQVQADDGQMETHYTRDGALYLSPTADQTAVTLVTSEGNPILGVNGPIVIPDGFEDISIDTNGSIHIYRNGMEQTVGQLALVEAVQPHLLEAVEHNRFRIPVIDGAPYDVNQLMQAVQPVTNVLESGALEQSNVDLSEQMTEMLMTQRAYQFNARTISMSDQMLGLINSLR
ncbi:flagellar hook-basal body protein [Ornithinibacillus gellani]|uniref:flagellar hook-basal body protein n=1 Tax=Ornithinibacillus gellani TaxID=2293253 RepID=UPI000F46465A|nr:flagellar hook-basal body protein [Ornithinibacillus gellani]TQS72185.1 flagellar hook-basal body protein [Ornithinibacillus gellani]